MFLTAVFAAAAAFSPALAGSIPLRWDPAAHPSLAGYRIYYGTTHGSYANSITINNAATSTYTISNLPAGTYYMTIRAFDTSNNESVSSPELSKIIK